MIMSNFEGVYGLFLETDLRNWIKLGQNPTVDIPAYSYPPGVGRNKDGALFFEKQGRNKLLLKKIFAKEG